MAIPRERIRARLLALLGPDPAGVVQGLGALSLGLLASLVAGLTLGSITGTLERLPGLLVLVPAARATVKTTSRSDDSTAATNEM
ncbi:MAG TPA: hypothetical protein VD926_10045, partial [Acidimicrobiales bacterium]|nr:hypothetical protein [Acidimicrobiales bacterium]